MVTINKILFITFVTLSLLLTACGSSSSGTAVQPSQNFSHIPSVPDAVRDNPLESVSGKTAIEYFRDEKILAGLNIGNSLDSHNGGVGGETTWGNPAINQALMNGIKAAGFDIVRIPVTWMGSFRSAPDYRLFTNRLERVAAVAEMARDAGLKAVINLHHDGSTQSGGRDLGWLSIGQASRNRDAHDRITAQYARAWVQIATYFQNYGDWLFFESFNELHDGSWQTTNDPGQFIILNRWNQLFVDIVRSTGGNNQSRYLIVGAYCKDNVQALSPGFIMPEDSVPDRLILSFHYYTPHDLAIQGSRSAWGTPADRERVETHFAPFKERFMDKNIPVIIGETGAVLQLHPEDPAREAQARQSRYDYIQHVFATASKYGLVPIYWDNGATTGSGEKFGLFDRRTGQPNSQDSRALITAMIRAVR